MKNTSLLYGILRENMDYNILDCCGDPENNLIKIIDVRSSIDERTLVTYFKRSRVI